MSEIALKWVRDLGFAHPEIEMTQGEFNVLAHLAHRQNPYSGICQISEAEIGRATRLSERHVRRVLNAICGTGALRWTEKGKSKSWASRFEFGLGFVFVPLGKPRELRTSCPATPDILSTNPGHPVRPYKERNKYKPEDEDPGQNHHAFGALMRQWIEIKTELQSQLPPGDYDAFIRPMYLFRAYGDALGLTLPPNHRMIERAKNCELLQRLVRARGYSGAIIGRYPTDDELILLQQRYPGIEESWGKTLRKRCEDLITQRQREDARDSGAEFAGKRPPERAVS
jgi:hypothetical protein